MTNINSNTFKVHTQWSHTIEEGDYVNAPFRPAAKILRKIDHGHYVEFLVDWGSYTQALTMDKPEEATEEAEESEDSLELSVVMSSELLKQAQESNMAYVAEMVRKFGLSFAESGYNLCDSGVAGTVYSLSTSEHWRIRLDGNSGQVEINHRQTKPNLMDALAWISRQIKQTRQFAGEMSAYVLRF